jgi:hypothetical protein
MQLPAKERGIEKLSVPAVFIHRAEIDNQMNITLLGMKEVLLFMRTLEYPNILRHENR